MPDLRLDTTADDSDAAELWPLHDRVFGDQPDGRTWRDQVWDRHADRDGFRLARAYDGGRLVGWAYGCTGETGQWWTDHVREELDPEVARTWLGGHFEVVTLGVDPAARRQGTGRALLRTLTEDLPHDRLLLMTTADADDPARRLYEAEGWSVLGPGVGEDTVVMGRRSAARPAGTGTVTPAGR